MAPRGLWRGVIVLLLLLTMVPPVAAQTPGNDPVTDIMNMLPARMKIGQLAMVSFPGTSLSNDADIAALITDYALGGVLLRPQNGNFGASRIAASDFISMTNRLQELAWVSSRGGWESPLDVLPYQAPYLPLFIAVEPAVEGIAVTSFITGASVLPSSMALGATWNRALAEATGQTVGRELAALGVNFYLGPDLNVSYTPRPGDAADLGVSVFGGDPYWVGELGSAYVRGLHQGSANRLAVAPRHFPGLGSADRPVEEEVPTVQLSLEQLKQIELAPFYTLARGMPADVNVADAFLVTHIRYRGFQGNIRQSTRPISFDAAALQLALQDVLPWRMSGGLIVSDNLGMKSVRRFDDPRELSFNARRVARDALLAGNDMLIMDHFALSETWSDHFANIRDTLEFMVQRYETDTTFQARVDEALYRIISLKLRLYPVRSLTAARVDPTAAAESLGRGHSIAAQVATAALTRLAPFSDDLLPPPPVEGERIVIFTQENPVTLAETGSVIAPLSSAMVLDTLLRLYGPDGSGQIRLSLVEGFTFTDLAALLENPTPAPEDPALVAVQRARWIIFATTGLDARNPESAALKTFLNQQAGLLEGRIVVFNFGAPYDLDSTEISKLDLYYALYSPVDVFVQAGMRALFQDLPATGIAPVSIAALSYSLPLQMTPDPRQIISLTVVNEEGQEMSPVETQEIRKDDIIYLRTSPVLDRNGNSVPDKTPVVFTLTYPQESRVETIAAETKNGIAFTSVTLDRVGLLDITVHSEPAAALFHLQLTIREGQSVIMISITPTPEPTPLPPTPTPEPTATPEPLLLPEPLRLPRPQREALFLWGVVGALMTAALTAFWAYARALSPVRVVRVGAWTLIGGMAGYIVMLLAQRVTLPAALHQLAGREFVMGAVALGGGGVTSLLIWALRWREEQRQHTQHKSDEE